MVVAINAAVRSIANQGTVSRSNIANKLTDDPQVAISNIGAVSYNPNTDYNGRITSAGTDRTPRSSPPVQRQVSITIHPMNDKPIFTTRTITGQLLVSIAFKTALTRMFSDLQVDDVDNTYPTGFTLTGESERRRARQ